jgi:hypothetical protein
MTPVKKSGLIYLAICLLCSAVAGYLMADTKVVTFDVEAKQVSFESTEELIDFSELIVAGEPLKSINHVIYSKDGSTAEAYTITQFRIDEIYENDTVYNVNEGDIIKVAEPTYVIDNGIKLGKTLFSYNGYENMLKNNKYLLLLVTDVVYDDLYAISGLSEGKHNISILSEDAEKVNVPQMSKHIMFKNELLQMYEIK